MRLSMRSCSRWFFLAVATVLALAHLPAANAAGESSAAGTTDPCVGFTWNVKHERSLFAGSPTQVRAGVAMPSAPRLATDRLYELALEPTAAVHFASPPSKTSAAQGPTFAGLVRLRVSRAGTYRISLDQPVWVDVVAAAGEIRAGDHEGQHDCRAPRKIVEFSLPANEELTMQLSSATDASLRVTVTARPDAD